MKQKLMDLKEEIDKSSAITDQFNIPLKETSPFLSQQLNAQTQQKISKDKEDLHNSFSQLELIDIYKIL
jgi:hypothetical protein